ncbi:Argininosuccinate lyase [Dissostichus eleginoides]|uniref:Argininosuccinate lyase n=1 Tax=Dissostichus eleginoides TaxID=100907 RepID=A0AAD9FI77_DISEL|nr:Argininosuccinate lyase [Dissostichus eleginoides]
MSGESQGREASCQAEESISWKQCIICQSDDDKKGVLVQHPKLESYGLVLQAVQERASLNDGVYIQVQRRLQNCTLETCAQSRQSGIAPVTQMQLTTTKYNVQETAMHTL